MGGFYMYSYSKSARYVNFIFAIILFLLCIFMRLEVWYNIVIGFVGLIILKDAVKEWGATFELKGDRMVVRSRDKVIREITYREMKYLTITRKNKKWVVIADDDRILFTIKPKIENHEEMVSKLIELNKSNKKLDIHDYIKKTYKK